MAATGLLALAFVAIRDRAAMPRAILLAPSGFDCGESRRWAQGSHFWIVRNEGRAPLRLDPVGSTMSSWMIYPRHSDPIVIPPGGQQAISVGWNTRNRVGKFNDSAAYRTNDPTMPSIQFRITGIVRTH